MSLEDTIISAVIFERMRYVQGDTNITSEARQINKYGRKMIKMANAGRINKTDSDRQIAKAISPILAWLFWQIADDLLLWIVAAIRKRIWQGT